MADSGVIPTRVRAVLLDCLGTLLELEQPGPGLRAELSARGVEVSDGAAAVAFRAEIAYYVEHHLDGSDAVALDRLRDACARLVADELGLDRDRVPTVRGAMLAALRFSPYADVRPALAALRRAGLRLVVASNWDCSLERTLAATGLRSLVDAVVTSAEVGAAKPDPAVLNAALEAAGCGPGDAVCVGDSLDTDVAAARAAGVPAILLVRGGGVAPAPVPVVASLDDARSLILTGG
jgi:putative hydrolase of the HAD superfamily